MYNYFYPWSYIVPQEKGNDVKLRSDDNMIGILQEIERATGQHEEPRQGRGCRFGSRLEIVGAEQEGPADEQLDVVGSGPSRAAPAGERRRQGGGASGLESGQVPAAAAQRQVGRGAHRHVQDPGTDQEPSGRVAFPRSGRRGLCARLLHQDQPTDGSGEDGAAPVVQVLPHVRRVRRRLRSNHRQLQNVQRQREW